MINQLEIKNFKSIQSLKLECKRVNVFIGEPNTGKSNILEAMSLFSQNAILTSDYPEILRMKHTRDLFFDSNINSPIEVLTDNLKAEIKYAYNDKGAVLNEFHLNFIDLDENKNVSKYPIALDGRVTGFQGDLFTTMIRYYQYKNFKKFNSSFLPHLSPPYGDNLPTVLLSNPEIKKWVSELFRSFGYKLMLWPTENDINMSKEVNEELFSYSYNTISETLQRIIFILVAIESNNNCSLIFDEPESNTFPFYTKLIAERFGIDKNNQFFITTHNPFMLMSIIQKTIADDLQICITKMEDYKTKIYPLTMKQIEKLLEYDVDLFFNLDRILES